MALFRLGSHIPAPGVDSARSAPVCRRRLHQRSRPDQPVLRRRAAAALGLRARHHAVLTASIILQLLTVVIPRLDSLKKEGQAGQAKITQYTRYLNGGSRDPAVHRPDRHREERPELPDLRCNGQIIYSNVDIKAMVIMVAVMVAGTSMIMCWAS